MTILPIVAETTTDSQPNIWSTSTSLGVRFNLNGTQRNFSVEFLFVTELVKLNSSFRSKPGS